MNIRREKMTLYNELVSYMKQNYNTNFHMDKEDWRTREILRSLCDLVEGRLEALERKKELGISSLDLARAIELGTIRGETG